MTAPASSRSSALTAPVGSTSNPIRTNLNVPGGPGGNKNGKRAAGLGLGLLGLGALASMNRGGGGNETGTSKAKPLASTTVPGKGGSPRRKEQLVGQKGDLKATDPVVADARKLNKMGGVSLGSGGTGYLATKGDKLVNVQAKGIGADDGIIGKAARKLGLTKAKDKALEAQRQNTSRTNREKYLQGQELTDKNVTGYQAKGAVRKGEKTGLNIKDSYEYDTFDTVLEYLIAEGYADTNESALAIMANMSEEWREDILDEGFKRMNRRKIEKQAQRLGGDKATTLRSLANTMDTPEWRKHSTSQARKNRAGGAGSEYRKGKELQARDEAKADIKKYGLH